MRQVEAYLQTLKGCLPARQGALIILANIAGMKAMRLRRVMKRQCTEAPDSAIELNRLYLRKVLRRLRA